MDQAWKVRPEVRRLTAEATSTYQRMWFDTCVFSSELVETLVAAVGADRVMLGSDYPFDMGDPNRSGWSMRHLSALRTKTS